MFSFLKGRRKVKNDKIVIEFNDEQLDMVEKILNLTRNEFLKQGIMFDELNEIYKKLFVAKCNEKRKIVIDEAQFNIIINVLNEYRITCEQQKINTLELDYTILEIITQKEKRGRQIEYAR